jgi:4-hydroxyphenylpyruvate dioxygenase-like putative hemolysin
MNQEKGFFWERHGEAEKACLDLLDDCKRKNAALARLDENLIGKTSSRLLYWVDHFILRDSTRMREKFEGLGFVRQPDTAHEAFYHPGALLPRIVLSGNSSGPDQGAALRVESIADFLQANGFRAEIEGGPLGPFRRAHVSAENGVDLTVVERRGTGDYEPVYPEDAYVRTYLEALEAWQTRPRTGDNEEQIFQEIFRIADRLVRQLGPDMAAHIVCLCERTYWLSRNFAARVQQGRQDTLGLGLANHDHHTFRSSRRNFSRLVSLFIRLGFKNRERFYAGAEAGWGAQVMENPAAGLTLFLDVDLAPEEVATEFSREELGERDQLGTVGLWCALHGDSILRAGMHHLAAQFDFERLIADLARHGVGYMAPFSNFPYLKQAFSVAERWEVDPPRVEKLVRDKAITAEQSERFLSQGAVGSHLEDIERREGYKGFNRKNVSAIIRETDPRRHVV